MNYIMYGVNICLIVCNYTCVDQITICSSLIIQFYENTTVQTEACPGSIIGHVGPCITAI